MPNAKFLILILVFIAIPLTTSAQSNNWRVVEEKELIYAGDGSGNQRYFRQGLISPNGQYIAYERVDRGNDGAGLDSFCRYEIATDIEMCLNIPENFPGLRIIPNESISRYTWAVWAPDSSKFAIAESVSSSSRDSDLWVIDFAEEQVTHYLDDDYDGRVFALEEGEENIFSTMSLEWAPDSTRIVFEYIDISARTSSITIFDLATQELTTLITLEDVFTNTIQNDENVPFFAVSQLAWSPDGTTLAMTIDDGRGDLFPAEGLWLIDLESVSVTQIYRPESDDMFLDERFPELTEVLYVENLKWSPDSQFIAMTPFYGEASLPKSLLYLYDVPANEFRLVEGLIVESEAGIGAYIPDVFAWSPDGQYLMVQDDLALNIRSFPEDTDFFQLHVIDIETNQLTTLPRELREFNLEMRWPSETELLTTGFRFTLERE